MAITVEMLRVRIGLDPGDASRDTDLTAALAQATAICETYCDRRFALADDVEQLTPGRYSLQVRRYPIVTVTSITNGLGEALELAGVQVLKEQGLILRVGGGGADVFTVAYRGGYEPLPVDLEYALLGAFDQVWATTPGWGAESGAQSTGDLQKISIVGVGSLDFASPTSSSASGDGGKQSAGQSWGILPVSVTSILSRYMRHTVIAGG